MGDKAQASRDAILDAAGRILVRDGGDALTIASVAREAGISKGGLFYHFASKKALVEGLVTRHVSAFEELITAAGEEPGAATKAYLRSAEHPDGPATQSVAALLAATVASPEALESLRERYADWQARLDRDGISPWVATAVRFAVDGIWLADVLGLAPVTGRHRSQVIAALEKLVHDADRPLPGKT